MKKNIVVRNGKNLRPSGPMVCMTTESSMKSMPDSATCWIPAGTRDALGLPARVNMTPVMTTAAR